jgi:hypothetical protein
MSEEPGKCPHLNPLPEAEGAEERVAPGEGLPLHLANRMGVFNIEHRTSKIQLRGSD